MTVRDEVVPGRRWEFGEDVTACFDDMLARSIPQYGVMRAAVADLALAYLKDGTDVVDLGASRGEALASVLSRAGRRPRRYVAVETSPPMLAVLRSRFYGEELDGAVRVVDLDLRRGYPEARASATLSILTLQFTPIEHRLRILRDAFDATVPGGVFVLVEKVIGASAPLDAAFVEAHHASKRASGYSQEDIDRKRMSLEGVLVPVTAGWNEELLTKSGFREVDCFWRWMNFAGWVAVR